MGTIIAKAKRISRLRLLSQFVALVILSLPFLGLRTICGPAFYCHSCPLSAFACPVGVLSNFAALRLFPYVAIGALGLIGALGGRLICGWVCPFGLLQVGLDKIRKRKITIPYKLTYVKYFVLVGLVLLVPLISPTSPYRFCKLCPAGTLESTIPRAFIDPFAGFTFGFILRVSILVGVLVLMIVTSRGFCRTLCPLGAIFSLFNKISLFRLNSAHANCNSCGVCSKTCPVKIDPASQMNNVECIRCLDCTTTQHLKLGTG